MGLPFAMKTLRTMTGDRISFEDDNGNMSVPVSNNNSKEAEDTNRQTDEEHNNEQKENNNSTEAEDRVRVPCYRA